MDTKRATGLINELSSMHGQKAESLKRHETKCLTYLRVFYDMCYFCPGGCQGNGLIVAYYTLDDQFCADMICHQGDLHLNSG